MSAETRFPGKTPHEIAEILIDTWHTLPESAVAGLPLHTYLGMSWAEYARYVEANELPPRWVRRV